MKSNEQTLLRELECPAFDKVWPDRSRLVSLAPIGQGTVRVESLTSYLVRLAGAHSVNPKLLIRSEYTRLKSEIANITRSGFFQKNSRTINGPSSYAHLFCEATEALTGLNGFRYMTLLPLEHLLPSNGKGLLHSGVQWCPDCFAESASRHDTAYRPLLWSFRHYRFCSAHRRELVNRCPRCGGFQYIIHNFPSVSHCCKCGAWLGQTSTPGEVPTDDDLWISSAVEDVVAHLANLEHGASISAFHSMIDAVIRQATSGIRKRFSKKLGLGHWTAEIWASSHRAGFQQWLVLAYGMNIMPSQLFLDTNWYQSLRQVDLRKIPATLKYRPHKPALSENELKDIEERLKTFADNPEHCDSLSSIAKALGQQLSDLQRSSPVLCQSIQEKYRMAVEQRSAQRLENAQAQLKAIIRDLIKKGEYPGGGKVNQRLRRQRISLIRPELRKIYRDEISKWKDGDFVIE